MNETAIVFDGRQGPLVGILARPVGQPRAALLLVAGQPQTRVGSHRMFTEFARGLAARGVASLRFDIGGWGDSPGEPLEFERSDLDIVAASAALRATTAAPLWIWGLCDGASAAVLALPRLRAAGLEPDAMCLVNPWVRSEGSLGDAMVRTYYARRLFDPAFWARLLSGRVPIRNLLVDPLRHLTARMQRGASTGRSPGATDAGSTIAGDPGAPAALPDLPSMLMQQLSGYRGTVLTVLSGGDLTAAETEALMNRDKRWRKRLDRDGNVLRMPGADHTFSDPEHWIRVCEWVAARAPRR